MWSVGFRALGSLATALEWLLYLEGHGDLVRGLIMGIKRATIWVIEAYLLSPHDPQVPSPQIWGLEAPPSKPLFVRKTKDVETWTSI